MDDEAAAQVLSRRALYRRYRNAAIAFGLTGAALLAAGAYEWWATDGSTRLSQSNGLPQTSPLIGQSAPDFTLMTLDGKPLSLASLRGRPVLLNFWATWCVPCKSELPALQRYSSEQAGRWTVLGVDELEDHATVASFARSLGVTYPLATDGDGAVGQRYGVDGMPTSFVIDASGRVRQIHRGPLAATDLRDMAASIAG